MATHSLDIGKEVCEILGLNASKTKNITIQILSDDVVYVQITQLAHIEELDKIMEKLKVYKLVKTDITDEITSVMEGFAFTPDFDDTRTYKSIRDRLGKSMRDVAYEAGVSIATISRMEKGNDCSLFHYRKVKNALWELWKEQKAREELQ